MKICSKCKIELPDEVFNIGSSKCKPCKSEDNKDWRANNAEKAKIGRAKWVKNNPEKVKEIRKRYYNKEDVKERAKVYKAEWRKKNLEKVKANFRDWCAKNKDRYYERVKSFKIKNPALTKKWGKTKRVKITDAYVSSLLAISTATLRQYPALIEAKRAQLQLLRAANRTKQ